ncbi:MAG: AI-2E family transporter [Cryobacterium sp.]|nr:AI-2E family transporter [Oligoflexia bacterium]
MSLSSKPLAWAFFILLVLAVALNLGLVSPFFLTLFLGWMLAEILRPFYARLLNRKVPPLWASLIATLAMTLVIVGPVAVFSIATIRRVSKTIAALGQDMKGLEGLGDKAYQLPLVARFFESTEEFRGWLITQGQAATKFVPGILSMVVGNVPNLLGQLALALIACYFFLCDGRRFSDWIAPRIPLEPAIRARVANRAKGMVVQSALATLAAAAVQAIIVFIGFLALKLPLAFLAFGVAFICAWLPILGVTPVWGAAMLFLFAEGHSGKAFIMLAIGMIAGVSDNLVRPWLLKGSSDLHPLISLLVIFGHLYFFGILGVFTGPVFAAVLIEMLDLWPEVSPQLGLSTNSIRSD